MVVRRERMREEERVLLFDYMVFISLLFIGIEGCNKGDMVVDERDGERFMLFDYLAFLTTF